MKRLSARPSTSTFKLRELAHFVTQQRTGTPRYFALAVALLFAWSLGGSSPARAQVLDPDDPIARISAQDIATSLISLNNFTASPGIEGSKITVDFNDGQPDVKYDRFSIQIPISIQTRIEWMNIYTDFGYGSLTMIDDFTARAAGGELIGLSAERTVDSGRMGIGLEFIPAEGLYIAPYFQWSMSSLRSKTDVDPPVDFTGITPEEEALLRNWKAAAWSVGGVLDVKYLHWFGDQKHRLDLQTRYSLAWAETFNESLPILHSGELRNTLTVEALWRSITDVHVFKKNLVWNVFVNSTSFPGQEKDDLGFTYYFGFGAGLDLYIPERLWGKIGRNFIGLRVSGIVGDDTRGWSLVISLRN